MTHAALVSQNTPADTASWSLRLQLRVMRLLLTHDARLFRGQFRTFFAESQLPSLPLFQQYDRYLRLVALSDELLDDVMPRVRRRLSLQISHERLREEAPTRGDIDWRRTIERSWRETPGLAPVTFDTKLRQRSTATPENILVVAALLALRRELALTIRDGPGDEALSNEERQRLVALDERAERELAAAYARALVEEARRADIDQLAAQVEAGLRPGPSPYRDLIVWWRTFRDLSVGRAGATRRLALASRRDDPKTDAWLYELWIALEIVHLLVQERAVTPADTAVAPDVLQLVFEWSGRRFRLRYNRQYEDGGAQGGGSGWEHGPASRPDYTIERAEPLEVRHDGKLIWREPPVVLDAKYYLSGQDPARTHRPIKKLLGDMLLVGATRGGLFFPLLPEPAAGEEATRTIRRLLDRHPGEAPAAVEVKLYHLAPDMPLPALQARLRAVLDSAAECLQERPPVACHGVWLDVDSINASQSPAPAMILCPKPHIGPGVYDLVSPEQHCLRDPKLCHVMGQPITVPFVVRAATVDGLAQQAQDLRARSEEMLRRAESAGAEELAEQLRGHIFTGIGRTVEQYVRLRGNTATIEEMFERWVFGEYWRAHPWALTEAARDMLLSGEYVWQEYGQTTLDDWAAPAIQFCRVLEHELRRRLCPAEWRAVYKVKGAGWTLGTPLHAFRYKDDPSAPGHANAKHNWERMLSYVAASGCTAAAFEQVLARLEEARVVAHRNTLAHSKSAPQTIAAAIRSAIIGDRRRPGALPWVVENLQPLT